MKILHLFMSDNQNPAFELVMDPPGENAEPSKKILGLDTVYWSVGIAIATGFATLLGIIRESGYRAALGLDNLTSPGGWPTHAPDHEVG
jgi:hypothetical protein